MKQFTSESDLDGAVEMRKSSTIHVVYCNEPFTVHTQEGRIEVDPFSVDDWDNDVGYGIAYPSDGSKPYPISPGFVRDNYIPV